MRVAVVGQETGARYGEMMARYLGPVILRAFADDDVTEIYLNPQDGVVRFDTRSRGRIASDVSVSAYRNAPPRPERSEEHTSELQSRPHLVCRLLLEKKKEHVSTPVTPASPMQYYVLKTEEYLAKYRHKPAAAATAHDDIDQESPDPQQDLGVSIHSR